MTKNVINDLFEKASELAMATESGSSESYRERLKQKFAELIVRECCNEITQEPFNAGDASVRLKEHFEIES